MVEDLGDGLERFATDFIDRTRQLKSLVLLRSSEPSEHTDKMLEDLEVLLLRAEKTMNQLKCKIAEECQAVRLAQALEDKSKLQAKHVEHCRRTAPEDFRTRLAEVQRKEEFSSEPAGGHKTRGYRHTREFSHADSSDKENSGHANNTERSRPKVLARVFQEEMDAVPGYLKGRLQSVDKVNEAIAEINSLLIVRASLCFQNLSKLSDIQHKQVLAWKDLDMLGENSKNGNVGLYETDLRATSLRVGEASSKDVVNVLKHLQRLREARGPSGEKAYICACA